MSYLKNKKNRLKTKYSNILGKDFGLVMSDSPTKYVVICNGGLCNGISQEMVCQVFERFDNMKEAIMVPGKSYCFIRFEEEMGAKKAFDQIDGELIWTNVKGPLHLGYVKDFNAALLRQGKVFKNPPGLILIEDFITEEEEESILNLVGFGEGDKNSSKLKHRKVRHFGYEFNYSTNKADLNEPLEKIPDKLNFLWERLKEHSDKHECNFNFVPDQLTVNCYEPGQGIPPHVDTHSAFEDGIISLSLLSSIVMEFKNCNDVTYNVLLKKRSLCLMLGESRYDWTHGITPRKSDLVPTDTGSLTIQNREKRISLTFRKTRTKNCECKYPSLCDTSIEKLSRKIVSNMKNISLKMEEASRLEGNYVHEVYDKIAAHFSETRHKPWPNVLKFVQSFGPGSILLDVGCGNGKYFTNQTERFEIGCDSNGGLIRVCRGRKFECFSCNCLDLPVRDEIADGCICIAVVHHLTTEQERRAKAIQEMIRVLRSKGRLLIYVWAKNQAIDGKKSSYLKQNRRKKKPKKNAEDEEEEKGGEDGGRFEVIPLADSKQKIVLPVHDNRTDFKHSDLLVPWKLKKTETDPNGSDPSPVFYRFYHVYEDEELKSECLKMKNVKVLDYYYDQGNWCIVLEKK